MTSFSPLLRRKNHRRLSIPVDDLSQHLLSSRHCSHLQKMKCRDMKKYVVRGNTSALKWNLGQLLWEAIGHTETPSEPANFRHGNFLVPKFIWSLIQESDRRGQVKQRWKPKVFRVSLGAFQEARKT